VNQYAVPTAWSHRATREMGCSGHAHMVTRHITLRAASFLIRDDAVGGCV
jgi:hypothetical protein